MSGKQTGNIIKEIKKKPSVVIVTFSNGEKIKLSHSSYVEFRLYEGKEIDEEELHSLLSYEKEGEFYDYALRLLGRENYTVSSMKEKLEGKGASKAQTDSIVKRLEEADLLNDERFARIYVDDIASLRCLGKNKVLSELRSKGIKDEILSSLCFDEAKEQERAASAVAMLNRKYAKSSNEAKKSKAIAALLSRGFSYEVASKAVEENLAKNDAEGEKIALLRDYDISYIRFSRKYEGEKVYEALTAYLLRKGYRYENVRSLIEEKKEENR